MSLVANSLAFTPAQVSTPYSVTVAAAFGVPPYTFSTKTTDGTAGTGLPPGLSIDPSTGTISGTPTTVGTYSFYLEVSDSTADCCGCLDFNNGGIRFSLCQNYDSTDPAEREYRAAIYSISYCGRRKGALHLVNDSNQPTYRHYVGTQRHIERYSYSGSKFLLHRSTCRRCAAHCESELHDVGVRLGCTAADRVVDCQSNHRQPRRYRSLIMHGQVSGKRDTDVCMERIVRNNQRDRITCYMDCAKQRWKLHCDVLRLRLER